MLAVVLLLASLGFSCVAATPDSIVHEGLTQRIRYERWSLQGYKSRNLLFARSQPEISTPARRLLQMDSPSQLSQPQLDAILTPQPLLDAARQGDLATVRREVAGGADVDTRDAETDATPLILASASGHTDIMLFLLQEGADIDTVDRNDLTALHVAAGLDELEAVEILIDEGAELDPVADGSTPLLVAAQKGYDDIVAALIDAGADIEAATDAGATPLILAAHDGQFNVVKALISGGADVNAKEEDDITALHYAARVRGGATIIAALLDAGADVDAQTDIGNTALHFASYFGQERNIEALIDAGADTTLRTVAPSGLQFGLTAEDLICRCAEGLEDADPEIEALCQLNSCSDLENMRALFD